MRSRRETAWRKSRTFGDVYGGRMAPKLTNRVFACLHSLDRPGPDESLPLVLQDNPSRDYFWPISGVEARDAVLALPREHHAGITHIWLRRKDVRVGDPLAAFICGSGVRLITLYPWRKDMKIYLGRTKPIQKWRRAASKFGAQTFEERGH